MIRYLGLRIGKNANNLRSLVRSEAYQLVNESRSITNGANSSLKLLTSSNLEIFPYTYSALLQPKTLRTFTSGIKGPDLDKESEDIDDDLVKNTSEEFLHEEFQRLDIANNEEDRREFVAQLKTANKRQRKFLMDQNAQPVNRSLFADEGPSLADEMEELGIDMTDFEMRVIKVNRTCKATQMGGLYRYSALVLAGNKKGLIGYALAKGTEPQLATTKAYKRACKNLQYFERFKEHTIWHESTATFCKSTVVLLPGASETGLKCNKVIRAVCDLAGIKNIRAKVHGSHHPHNTLHATFKALNNIYSPSDMSALRSRYVEVY
eukprot:CAMPEP_0196574834 /NCGR_PEP_ID=MMETSP1081-20130531/4455_1 /TAXON_ID=36882 /ORGANISM="Pyramimonas amylifera, Strain CCMP720" /LENGTH=320 /DNA_ID=CAMNT_0041892959 /DNA_START=43 /DNA_END=1005 /DNA_ORIENTATION=+